MSKCFTVRDIRWIYYHCPIVHIQNYRYFLLILAEAVVDSATYNHKSFSCTIRYSYFEASGWIISAKMSGWALNFDLPCYFTKIIRVICCYCSSFFKIYYFFWPPLRISSVVSQCLKLYTLRILSANLENITPLSLDFFLIPIIFVLLIHQRTHP